MPDAVLAPAPPARSDAPGEHGTADAPGTCASCGQVLHGEYCHACGEKRLGPHDYHLAHFAEHAADALTHFDFKVPQSLWSLLRRPGAQAADVLAGRRVRWAKPLQTFIFANLIFYLVASALSFSFFDAPLSTQTGSRYGAVFRSLADAKAAALGLAPAAFAARYDALSHTLAKSLVVALVPLVTGLLALLFALHRRHALEHATAAILLVSQFMLGSLVAIGLGYLVVLLTGTAGGDALFVPLVLGVNALLFYSAFRRIYSARRATAAAWSAVFTFGLLVLVIFVYRPFLFLVTLALL